MEISLLLHTINKANEELRKVIKLPSEVKKSDGQFLIPNSLFENTRGYLTKIVYQINLSYSSTCYDACAVMIRRLIEVLIIEIYENAGRASEIKDQDENYLFLDLLVNAILSNKDLNLGRNTKKGLRNLKTIGDLSAHSRNYNARREYIDDLKLDIRVVSEDLLYLSGLKK